MLNVLTARINLKNVIFTALALNAALLPSAMPAVAQSRVVISPPMQPRLRPVLSGSSYFFSNTPVSPPASTVQYPVVLDDYFSYPIGVRPQRGRIQNSTLINPTIINSEIRDSVLINPTIIHTPSRRSTYSRSGIIFEGF